VLTGLAGVVLVVWHKIDVRAITAGANRIGADRAGCDHGRTLYQRAFCRTVDLRAASVVQFAATAVVMAPLAVVVEGAPFRFGWPLVAALAFLVIFASILAVNALHTLMRRGEATRVTSLLYLTPIFAVALEWVFFSVVPNRADCGRNRRHLHRCLPCRLAAPRAGARPEPGMNLPPSILLLVLAHIVFTGARVTTSLYALANGAVDVHGWRPDGALRPGTDADCGARRKMARPRRAEEARWSRVCALILLGIVLPARFHTRSPISARCSLVSR